MKEAASHSRHLFRSRRVVAAVEGGMSPRELRRTSRGAYLARSLGEEAQHSFEPVYENQITCIKLVRLHMYLQIGGVARKAASEPDCRANSTD